MKIQYKDFSPSAVEPKVFWTKFEDFSRVVDRANEWIRDSGVTVLNVETVVLPNVFQIVRIWYDEEKSKN